MMMVKAGTNHFSNCSRDCCAGKLPPSLFSNSAEPPLLRASSSYSSFSVRSRSSRRIWNQLTPATMVPMPMKIAAIAAANAWPVRASANVATAATNSASRFTNPFFLMLRSTRIKN